jgi:hypothetical protein
VELWVHGIRRWHERRERPAMHELSVRLWHRWSHVRRWEGSWWVIWRPLLCPWRRWLGSWIVNIGAVGPVCWAVSWMLRFLCGLWLFLEVAMGLIRVPRASGSWHPTTSKV